METRDGDQEAAHTLARRRGPARIVVPALLAASLACNVSALFLPFMEIAAFLRGRTPYSLPRSVALMWEADLYAIAVLVLAFSIAFPFAKLAVLAWAWFLATDPAPLRAILRRIEPLGKWSFLDIFIVCVILILSNDQIFVRAEPRIGLYSFVAAIAMSMISAAMIDACTREPDRAGGGAPAALAARPGWARVGVPVLLLLALVAIFVALVAPFLEVSQFLLAGHAYGLWRAVEALWSDGAYVPAVLAALTLVAAPLASIAAMGVVWFARLSGAGRRRWRRAVETTWQWAMLDVFGLAVLVFMIEGRAVIATEAKPGLYAVVGAIAVMTASRIVIVRCSRRIQG
jgi:paraquat-inducible protein A